MADTDHRTRLAGWRVLLERVRLTVGGPLTRPTPDYAPAGPQTERERWLRELARTRDLLERTRTVVAQGGWCGGGSWFTIRQADGSVRAASLAESFELRAPGAPVAGACLVAIMIRLAEDPDAVASVADVWRATDELVEALHERHGHRGFPPGRSYPMTLRRARLRVLTAWNDEPGRAADDVLDVIDRAIARTIQAAVAAAPARM